MFISKYDKEEMRISIRTLQANLSEVLTLNKTMKQAIIDLEDRIITLERLIVKKEKKKTLLTPEAPWGYKLDGTPKKRPGFDPNKTKEVKSEQP